MWHLLLLSSSVPLEFICPNSNPLSELGGGVSGGDWIMKVGTPLNGINVLIRRDIREDLFLWCHVRTQQEGSSVYQTRREPTPEPDWLVPWSWTFWSPEPQEERFLLFGFLLQRPQMTQTATLWPTREACQRFGIQSFYWALVLAWHITRFQSLRRKVSVQHNPFSCM